MNRWAIVVFLLLMGACVREADPGERPDVERSSPSRVSQTSGCQAEGALLQRAIETGSVLEADLDEDGSEEQIVLAADPGGSPGCKAFLAVRGPGLGSLAVPLEDEMSFDLGLPAVAGVAEIDGEAPKEIVVNLVAGASTGFAGVFSVQEGRLERMLLKGDSPYSSLFPFGGSVGHAEGSDCAAPGAVVVSSATATGDGYEVVRRFFVAAGSSFVLDDSATETQSVGPRDLGAFSEFASAPFPSCPQ